ncbi:MAG: hypothetical protein JXM79_19735 [Sedimentisphaerales bacterium]|nr:hypothetical protein [Sedimentisphaerales bacterium]
MCRLEDGLRSGRFPAILYSDGTSTSKNMQSWLDTAGAKYAVSSSKFESMGGPVLVVDGTFLGPDDVKDVLGIK